MLPSHSQSGRQLKPLWFTDRNPSLSLWWLWQSPKSSVSCSSLPAQCVLLSKDIGHQVEKNSFSLCKDWQELREKIKKLATTMEFAQILVFGVVGFGCLGSIALVLATLIGRWFAGGYSWVVVCIMH